MANENNGEVIIKVSDNIGRVVKLAKLQKESIYINTSIDISDLRSGMYFIEFIFENKKNCNKKIIIR